MAEVLTPFPIIRKRDGRLVKFDKAKISQAIIKAFTALAKDDLAMADKLAGEVIEELKKSIKGTVPQVEEIQDAVEKVLIRDGFAEIAKSYIIYRHMRTNMREGKSALMDTVEEILSEPQTESLFRINSPSAKMLKIASAASRSFYLSRLIPAQFSEAHNRGEIHIHDLDFYGKTIASFQIPLAGLLEKGFFAGYAFIRPPKRISTATALTAIILQSCQNEMFGCQSFPAFDQDLAAYAEKNFEPDEKSVCQAMEGLVYNLNCLYSRVGAQVPLSCINLGDDPSPWGRLISKALLKAIENGLGKGETPLFPQVIFKLKKGINLKEGDPNFDLFSYAVKVASRRMNPTFAFLNSPFNQKTADKLAYFSDGARMAENPCGDSSAEKRGVLAAVTINLPRVALKIAFKRTDILLSSFYNELDRTLNLATQVLLHRYDILSHLKASELPFLMGGKLYQGSENLSAGDEIEPALKNANLFIGFIGLPETLMMLFGGDQSSEEKYQKRALEIVEFMKGKTEDYTRQQNLNFVLGNPPAESLVGKFAALDLQNFGEIPGVNDKGYYTNGFHLLDNLTISRERKIELEAAFHSLTPGGHFSFIEFPTFPQVEEVQKVILKMADSGIGYGGISFPLNECMECASIDIQEDTCRNCGNKKIRKIRRVSTFLTPENYLTPVQKKMLSERKAQV